MNMNINGVSQDIAPGLSEETQTVAGAMGAVVGGVIGALAWAFLTKITGYEIGYAAWGVGLLVGFGATKLARGGNKALGIIAGACALVAILGGQFLALKFTVDEEIDKIIVGAYDRELVSAHNAVNAAEDDESLRLVIAQIGNEEGQTRAATDVTSEELTRFRAEELPHYQSLVNGSPTKVEFENNVRAQIATVISPYSLFVSSLSLFTALWIFLGVGTAYRMGCGAP